MQNVPVGKLIIGLGQPLTLISGPCVIEGEDHTLRCAEQLQNIADKHSIQLIFKASYDKANRSSAGSFRGPGIEEGLRILQKVKELFGLPVTTDVHSPEEALIAGAICDMIQIPAFLSRQTDLILAAGKSGSVVNVKKGQFLSPWDMRNVVEKILSTGNSKIILTDRGTSFGYNNLVSDFRAIPVMQSFGFPVCFDASHSTQLPGGLGSISGGQREFIPTLAKAAVAAGCNALFIESHPTPALAKSDASTVLSLESLKNLLPILEKLYDAVREDLYVASSKD
jgi:2-dehydro-3-deoxyphosphooctonate aldolase (KDO 8-P synthase)